MEREPAKWGDTVLPSSQGEYNIYAGNQMAKQTSESLEEFLSRLMPSATASHPTPGAPIMIANPTVSSLPNRDAKLFFLYAERHLDSFERDIGGDGPERSKVKKLKNGLLDLAWETGVVSGKWMLFPSNKDVDEVWGKVARATHDNRLGFAAKVTARGTDSCHVITIHTPDFSDGNDVARVLHEMSEVGLISNNYIPERKIYYKCDAFSMLEIRSWNIYGLSASLYNSQTMRRGLR
jgi:hypothetical protein